MHGKAAERFDRPAQHGLAGQPFILFWQAQPGSLAFSGGDNQDGDTGHGVPSGNLCTP